MDWKNKIIFAIFLLFSGLTFIPVQATQDDGIYTYVFYLYFDNGKLWADRDFEFPFELIAGEWQGSRKTAESYYGEILSVSSQKLADFSVVIPAGSKGKLASQAPYFANAKTANFYNPQNEKILSIDLAPSGPVCNEDKVCNNDTGETYLNCSSDCSVPVSPSVSPVPGYSFSLTDFLRSTIFWLILTIVLVVILVWIFFRRKRNNSQDA